MDSKEIAKIQIRKICFIGGGFVGGTSAAVFARNLPTTQIFVVDNNTERIKAWNSEILPVQEPGLLQLLQECRAKSYSPFGTESTSGIAGKQKNLHFLRQYCGPADIDLIFICVSASQNVNKDGNIARELRSLEHTISDIAKFTSKRCLFVEKSTIHFGTSGQITLWLSRSERPAVSFEVLSNPEFLAEGTAVNDLQHPNRVLIGSRKTPSGLAAVHKLSELYQHWVPLEKIITTDAWSSELSKLCANALLAQRVCSINSFSMICEKMNADVREIAKVVKSDDRIGKDMLNPSPGFGGSCFTKDLETLAFLAYRLDLPEVADYWKAALTMNHARKLSYAETIGRRLEAEGCGRGTVAVFGFTFKANTNDTRDSPAIAIVKYLQKPLRQIRIYDPHVNYDDVKACLRPSNAWYDVESDIVCCDDPYEACQAVSAIIVLTEWAEFGGSGKDSPAEISGDERSARDIKEAVQDDHPIKHEAKVSYSNAENPAKRIKSEEDAIENETSSSPKGHSRSESPTSAEPFLPNRLPGFRNPNNQPVDWERVSVTMAPPHLIFDGRDIVDDSIERFGFEIVRMGRKPA